MITHTAITHTSLPWLFAMAGVFCIIVLHGKRKKEQQKIRNLCKRIQDVLADSSPGETAIPFAASLSQATITTRLQQPSLQLQSGVPGEAPEKYKFFSNMMARGMNAGEISDVLGISASEASQLTRLCELGNTQN